jgi:putative Holliday junction resolvase
MVGRILALDLGKKRIGLAISDELGITAQGLETVERRGRRDDIEDLRQLAVMRGVTKTRGSLRENWSARPVCRWSFAMSAGQAGKLSEHFAAPEWQMGNARRPLTSCLP